MSNIILKPNESGTGNITIETPNTNTDRTLNIPDTTGNIVTTGDTGSVTNGMISDGAVTSAKLGTDITSRLDDVDKNVITEIDQFQLTSNFTATANTFYTLTNLSRVTIAGFSQKGTGMSHSSGAFVFPSAGYYLIDYRIGFVNAVASANYAGGTIELTDNNFSTVYDDTMYSNIFATTTYDTLMWQHIFKVDDTSTHRCKFKVYVAQNCTVEAGRTSMRFIRLGDV